MFREMRRKHQILSEKECIDILNRSTSGTLALLGDDDYPYAVPMSYVFCDGKIFFHSAITGHKIDAVKRHNKASFCVIYKDDVLPEKFTTCFQSVIAFGEIRIIENDFEKRKAIEILSEKYSPGLEKENEINGSFDRMHMIEFNIEHMTGKEAIELVKIRENKQI